MSEFFRNVFLVVCATIVYGCAHDGPPLNSRRPVPIDLLVQSDMVDRDKLIVAELAQDQNAPLDRTVEIGKVKMVTSADVPAGTRAFCFENFLNLALCTALMPIAMLPGGNIVLGAAGSVGDQAISQPVLPNDEQKNQQEAAAERARIQDEYATKEAEKKKEQERNPLGASYGVWTTNSALPGDLLVELDTAYLSAFRSALDWPENPKATPPSEPLVPAFASFYADWVWIGISRVMLIDGDRANPMIVLCARALIQYTRQQDSINRHFETCRRESIPSDKTSWDRIVSPRFRSLLRDLVKHLAATQAKALTGQAPIISLYR